MERKITKVQHADMKSPLLTKVAGYARVSGAKDEMLHSLAAQISYYRGLIQSNPAWIYSDVYADEALTGTKDARPEFQRLLADCRAGKVDIVLTKSIARFARNTVTLLETVRELKLLGVGVWFEEQGIDTLSGDGELMLTILASYAQEESRSVSDNCKWRVRKDFEEGKLASGLQIYGFTCEKGAFTIVPDEADVVRMIFADYLSGKGKNAIVKKLTRLGIPSKTGAGWCETGISDILRNEKYAGDLLLQKTFVQDHLSKKQRRNQGELPQYYVRDHHAAIVDRETFDAAQAEIIRRADRARGRKAPRYSEFTGLIRCGNCGANYGRKINASGTKYARVNWACPTFTNRGKDACPAKRIREDILMEKCAEALGLAEYDADALRAQVLGIDMPEDGVLIFRFKDGSEKTITWEKRSRRDSWTDEMKAAARAQAARKEKNDDGQ